MNEPVELQEYTWEKFNKLMYRASLFFPDWANHIKKNNNYKTLNCNYPYDEMIWEETEISNWNEKIILENGEIREFSNTKCCIIGEAYFNKDTYSYPSSGETSDNCGACVSYSNHLFYGSQRIIGESKFHIVDLEALDECVKHLEDTHPELNKEVIKNE